MVNKLSVPKYKLLDRVKENQKITLVTDKVHFHGKRERYLSPKRGIIRSEGYKKGQRGGAKPFWYNVQWDGRTHTDPIPQHRLTLEEKDYNQNDSTVTTNG